MVCKYDLYDSAVDGVDSLTTGLFKLWASFYCVCV